MDQENTTQIQRAKATNREPRGELKTRVYLYALRIIEFVDKLPKNDSVTRIIDNQLIRSGTSVAGNTTEAESASSKKDFINFYNHGLKSANESSLWIRLLRDSGRSDVREAALVLRETDEIAKMLAASILTMKGKRKL